jgi:hypothetical protein
VTAADPGRGPADADYLLPAEVAGAMMCYRPAGHDGPRIPGAAVFCHTAAHHLPSTYAPRHSDGYEPDMLSRAAELADAQALVDRAGAAMDRARAALRDAAEQASVTQNDYTRAEAVLAEVKAVQAAAVPSFPEAAWDYSTLPKAGPSLADVRKHVSEQRDHWDGFLSTMASAQGRDLAAGVVAVLTDVLDFMDGEL